MVKELIIEVHDTESILGNLLENRTYTSNGYVICDMLGQGTFGVVFKAYKPRSFCRKRYYAIKSFKVYKNQLPPCSRFEVDILLKLNHENVVRVHDFLETSFTRGILFYKTYWMIMDYIDNDLSQLDFDKLTNIHKESLIIQSIKGLDFIHSNNVMHRDIKPKNILVDKNGVLKFADFGLACYFDENGSPTDHDTYIGTIYYRAPELLFKITEYTSTIDIWSLGVTFCEFWNRIPLFEYPKSVDIIQKVFGLIGCYTKDNYIHGYTRMNETPLNFIPNNINHIREFCRDFQVKKKFENLIYDMLKLNPNERPSAKQLFERVENNFCVGVIPIKFKY